MALQPSFNCSGLNDTYYFVLARKFKYSDDSDRNVLTSTLLWSYTGIFLAFWTEVLNVFLAIILVFSILPVLRWS